jgi:SAM-dependent MidA family methyltransferase
LFGRVLARQCATVLEEINSGDTGKSAATEGQILELGAGTGTLAATMLDALSELGTLPDKYLILEVSPDLQQRQERLLRERVPALFERVVWLAQLPEDFRGVVIANEVADALPVERFQIDEGVVWQSRVIVDQGRLAWHREAAPAALSTAVDELQASLDIRLPDQYQSEICLALAPWIQDLVRSVNQGLLFMFDYGVTGREYYAPDRHDGWLRCHFRHRVHSDALILPGIQDLTAWVDFSSMAAAAVAGGAEVAGFVSQAHFLVNGGLQEELAGFESLPIAQQVEISRQAKLLTLPGEMGESFKCMGLICGDLQPPAAFSQADRTHML